LKPEIHFLPWLDRLSRWPRGWLNLLFAALTLAVGVADYFSGERYTVYILYFPIVALGCWVAGLRTAIVLSLFGSILWILDDVFAPPEPMPYLAKYWQAFARFLVFVAFANVLSRLRAALSREKFLSHYDELTGLPNRMSLFEIGQRDLARCRRMGRPLTVAFIDLDQFKEVNDKFGHAEGDKVLRTTASIIRNVTRDTDLIARIGGDEFVIVAAEMSYDAAEEYAARLQMWLRDSMQKCGWPVTFSMGVATFTSPPGQLDELIKIADDLMYTVKHKHKDAVQHCLVDADHEAPVEVLAMV
jgi:diguanylate cyclase (GGDEF)-like protein